MKDIVEYTESIFEKIKHIDEKGNEYWEARELMLILEYTKWQNFHSVIKQAMNTCKNSNYNTYEQFTEVSKPIIGGNKNVQLVKDYHLTRYACYLIAQNGDSRKKVIALAQTYFAVQTRKQELLEQELDEEQKRIIVREKTRKGNLILNQTAKKSGVKNYDKFHNSGYRGLYNGESADDIAKRKGLRYREEILDNMGSEELVDNLFRIIHTEEKLKREKVCCEKDANDTHYKVGVKIRETLKDLGAPMPEELPTPKKSIKKLDIKNEE